MWVLERLGLTPHLERRVRALETWRNAHETWAHEKSLGVESDYNLLVADLRAFREELHADRQTRAELGTMNTEAILQGFKEAAEGIVTRVLDRVWEKVAINRADIDGIEMRVKSLEAGGERAR